jgi:hypothetical protein
MFVHADVESHQQLAELSVLSSSAFRTPQELPGFATAGFQVTLFGWIWVPPEATAQSALRRSFFDPEIPLGRTKFARKDLGL